MDLAKANIFSEKAEKYSLCFLRSFAVAILAASFITAERFDSGKAAASVAVLTNAIAFALAKLAFPLTNASLTA